MPESDLSEGFARDICHFFQCSGRDLLPPLVEHLFAGEVMRFLWLRGNVRMEVLKPQVDDGGYDLVLEANDVVRHVHLKACHSGAATHHVNVSLSLRKRPSGCVVWTLFDEQIMELGPFLWLGGAAGSLLPDLGRYAVAKHPKANSKGVKGALPSLRSLPRHAFSSIASAEDLVLKLFGPLKRHDVALDLIHISPGPPSDASQTSLRCRRVRCFAYVRLGIQRATHGGERGPHLIYVGFARRWGRRPQSRGPAAEYLGF